MRKINVQENLSMFQRPNTWEQQDHMLELQPPHHHMRLKSYKNYTIKCEGIKPNEAWIAIQWTSIWCIKFTYPSRLECSTFAINFIVKHLVAYKQEKDCQKPFQVNFESQKTTRIAMKTTKRKFHTECHQIPCFPFLFWFWFQVLLSQRWAS